MPATKPRTARTISLPIRWTEEEVRETKRRAELNQLTWSEYVRRAATGRLRRPVPL